MKTIAIQAAAILFLGLAGCSTGDGQPDRHPHIILVSADTLRADHLSFNGYPRTTSPAIDAFAESAWQFTQAVTVIPTTAPSFATLFSGWHPLEHGVHHNRMRIPAEVPLLAEILQDGGYRTAAFVASPAIQRASGFERGFEHFSVSPVLEAGELFERRFLPWAEAPWDRPTLVWLHFLEPHGPYTPPPAFAEQFVGDELHLDPRRVKLEPEPAGANANKVLGTVPAYQRLGSEDRVAEFVRRYDAEIRYLDSVVSRLLSFLEDRGLYDESVVIFTSDHGESLGEHDYYFEHGWFAYDNALRIPLLIKEPRQTEGHRVDAQVSNLDFVATVLGLAGMENVAGVPGRDLLGTLDAEASVLVVNSGRYPERYVGVRSPQSKYLREVSSGAEELYDLRAEPHETVDRSRVDAAGLERAEVRMRQLLAALREPAADAGETLRPGDVQHLEELRALGYLD